MPDAAALRTRLNELVRGEEPARAVAGMRLGART
jgi:hypothetical protein